MSLTDEQKAAIERDWNKKDFGAFLDTLNDAIGSSAPVTSVNSQTGDVVLGAGDVGADVAGAAAAAQAASDASGSAAGAQTAAETFATAAIATAIKPTVTSVVPNNGGHYTLVPITIHGSKFLGPVQVTLGGVACGTVVVVSDSEITCDTCSSGPGTMDVQVLTPLGASDLQFNDRFTIVDVPTVTALSVNTGPAAGGTGFDITGTGFAFATNVKVDGADISFSVVDDNHITGCISPAHAAGVVDVTVTNASDISAPTGADQFTYV